MCICAAPVINHTGTLIVQVFHIYFSQFMHACCSSYVAYYYIDKHRFTYICIHAVLVTKHIGILILHVLIFIFRILCIPASPVLKKIVMLLVQVVGIFCNLSFYAVPAMKHIVTLIVQVLISIFRNLYLHFPPVSNPPRKNIYDN